MVFSFFSRNFHHTYISKTRLSYPPPSKNLYKLIIMKIPTSSSVLLATLAISSSSSCLAAPAGDTPQDTGLTTSSSTSHMSSMPSASAAPGFRSGDGSEAIVERLTYSSNLEARGASLDPVCQLLNGLPLVGPPLAKILGPLCDGRSAGTQSVDRDGTDSAQGVDPQDMEALQAAKDEITRALNAVGSVPGVAGGAVGGVTPIHPNAGSGSSTYASPTPASSTQTAQAADVAPANSTSTTAYSSASAAPSSPPMPKNPPNTPSPPLPVNAPALPVANPV